jgi:AcrR family transcriptional regulator
MHSVTGVGFRLTVPKAQREREATRRRLRGDERRAVIIEAASRTFAERGYLGASMERIAAAAGVSAPLIYEHFESKKQLYIELLDMHGRALVAATTREEGFDSVEELLRANTRAFFEFVREHPSAWRMLFLDPAPDPDIAETQRNLQAAATKRLAQVIVARVRKLKVSAKIPRTQADELIAEAGKSALNGLAVWWWDHPDVSADTLAAVAMDLLWSGLGSLGTTA